MSKLVEGGLAGLGSAGWRLLWLLWLVGSRSAGEKSGERIRDRSDFGPEGPGVDNNSAGCRGAGY